MTPSPIPRTITVRLAGEAVLAAVELVSAWPEARHEEISIRASASSGLSLGLSGTEATLRRALEILERLAAPPPSQDGGATRLREAISSEFIGRVLGNRSLL